VVVSVAGLSGTGNQGVYVDGNRGIGVLLYTQNRQEYQKPQATGTAGDFRERGSVIVPPKKPMCLKLYF
jgi:hypothetical protein